MSSIVLTIILIKTEERMAMLMAAAAISGYRVAIRLFRTSAKVSFIYSVVDFVSSSSWLLRGSSPCTTCLGSTGCRKRKKRDAKKQILVMMQ